MVNQGHLKTEYAEGKLTKPLAIQTEPTSVSPAGLEELRRLLLAPYLADLTRLQAHIDQLEARLAEQQTVLDELEPRIAQAVSDTLREAQDEIIQALSPLIAPALKKGISTAREDIIDALYPVIGSTITRSLTEAVRGMVEAIDQNLKKSLSFKGVFKRKVQSKTSGLSEGTLALRDALPFSVTELFLIHTETGLLITHVRAPSLLLAPAQPDQESSPLDDRDLVSGMLTAIRDFVRESFKDQNGTDEHSQLNRIQYGGLTILIEPSRYVYLAVVYAGVAPANYASRIREVLNWIHGGYARPLRAFGETGDGSKLVKVRDLLYNLIVKNA